MSTFGVVPTSTVVTPAAVTEMARIEVQTTTDQSPTSSTLVNFGSTMASVASQSSNAAGMYDSSGNGTLRTIGYPGLFVVCFDLACNASANAAFMLQRDGVDVQKIGRENTAGAVSQCVIVWEELVKQASPGPGFQLFTILSGATVQAGSRMWIQQVA